MDPPTATDSDTSHSAEICKYCFEERDDLECAIIYPCNCTTGVCLKCFEQHVRINHKQTCEMCQVDYVIPAGIKIELKVPATPAPPLPSTSETSGLINSQLTRPSIWSTGAYLNGFYVPAAENEWRTVRHSHPERPSDSESGDIECSGSYDTYDSNGGPIRRSCTMNICILSICLGVVVLLLLFGGLHEFHFF